MNYLAKRKLFDRLKLFGTGIALVFLLALSFMAGVGTEAFLEGLLPIEVNITYRPDDMPFP